MKIAVDTEFMAGDGRLTLISVGVMREDGRTYYAEVQGVDFGAANPWVLEHVVPQLHGLLSDHVLDCGDRRDHSCPVRPLATIATEFLAVCSEGGPPEFWADYGAYDYVILSENLFGGMQGWPEGWPMYFNDVQQWAHQLGDAPLPAMTEGHHQALNDAMQTMARVCHLKNLELAIASGVMKPELAREMRGPGGLVLPGRA